MAILNILMELWGVTEELLTTSQKWTPRLQS